MKSKSITSNHGFTLAELLVAMALSGLVMTSIYSVYNSQQKSYVLTEQVAAMQQNLRAAMYSMAKNIRMAGCDPTSTSGAGIITAASDSIQFTMDIHDGLDNDADGTVDEDSEIGNVDGFTDDTNENISYYLNDGNLVSNSDDNIIAENIEVLEFVYLTASGTTTTTLTEIKSIQISMVARTGKADPGYTNDTTYYDRQGGVILSPQNDHFHRKCITIQVRCRNL